LAQAARTQREEKFWNILDRSDEEDRHIVPNLFGGGSVSVCQRR